MQVTETHSDGLKHEFKVVMAASDIDEKVQHRLKELGSSVKIPGFRPGKVPLSLLRQRFGKSVMGEVLESAVNDGSSQAMMERGLRPALQPEIEIVSFEDGADLEFNMKVEVLPEIQPMDFSTIELEQPVVQVPDEEVERALEGMAEQQRRSVPVETPRPAKEGDVVVVDFTGRIDGTEFAGGAAEDYHLHLGSGTFIPGFEEQLVGAKPGDKVAVEVTFPTDYGNEELAGKQAVFDVEVKALHELVPAVLDDELAKSMGLEDMAGLRRLMRERIENEYAELARGRLKRALLDILAENHDFPVPAGMVDLEFDSIWKQIQEAKEQGRQAEEDVGKSEDELKADYRAIAERRVRLGLLLSTVGERNNIQVAPEEVNRAMMEEARRHPGHEREVLEFFQSNAPAVANLRAPIFENKVVDFIIEMAQVKDREMTVDELIEEPPEAEAGKKQEAKAKAKG